MTFELSVGNAVPLSTSTALARTAHHVTKRVMAFVPLVTHTVHDIINGADFLMSWINMKKGNLLWHKIHPNTYNKHIYSECT